jgi:DNA polymerase III delta subunit
MDHKNHIFVFNGNLSLTIDRKIMAWRENFIAKHGDFAVSSISLEETTPELLVQELTVDPFLANARLVIVRGGLKLATQYDTPAYWNSLLERIPANNFIVFHEIEALPVLSSLLDREATVKDFSIHSVSAAEKYIEDELPEISSEIVSKIALALFPNIPLLQSEVAKLKLIPNLSGSEALANCTLHSEKEIFKGIDALLAWNPNGAVMLLQITEASNQFELLSEITRAIRKPAIYIGLLLSGYSISQAQIATGIKDYPAKKYAAGSRKNKEAFIKLYTDLCVLDLGSKTGWLGSTDSTIGEYIISAFLNYHFCLHSA